MRCNRILVACLSIFVFTGFQGCGMFGSKQDPSSVLTYQTADAGCLDNVGTQVKAYANGTISEQELTSAWGCVSSSMTLFTQFIRGSVPNGYTPQDIQTFMSHFLFSQSPISMDLVQSVFALKASIFGGTADVLTFDEINNFLALASVLQTETTKILPHLANRTQNPTPKNLLLLSKSIQHAGKKIAGALNTANNPPFNVTQIQTLVTELESVITPNTAGGQQTGQFVVAIKQLLALGGNAAIEASSWPLLIESLMNYFGPALSAVSFSPAFATGANAQDGFFSETIGQVSTALNATIAVNGGSIPFASLTNMIQYIPDSFLNAEQRSAVSGAQEMVFSRLLQSKTANAIDANVTTTLMQQVTFWDSVETIINNIYTKNNYDPNVGATADQLTADLSAYASAQTTPAPAPTSVTWMTSLIQNYTPYFAGTDQEISFPAPEAYSVSDIKMKHLIRLVSQALLNGYSSNSDKTQIDYNDFATFIADVVPILNAWKMSDPSLPDGTEARFLQANLFMPSSNGDDFVSLDEGSQYILYFLSIYNLAQKVEPVVNSACASYGIDAFGTSLMNAECFRTAYFANYQTLWQKMPLLQKYYASLTSAEQQTFDVAVENASRLYGYSSQCVGFNDVESMQGILHYIETILERFDSKGEGMLDTDDAMVAFPLFQNELITAGKSSGLSATNTGEQKAAFAYALAKGRLPKTGISGDLEFLWWWIIVGEHGWNIKAERTNLYETLSNISPPLPPPATSQCE